LRPVLTPTPETVGDEAAAFFLDLLCGGAEEDFSWFDVAGHPGLCSDDDPLADLDVANEAGLRRHGDVSSQDGAPGHSALGDEDAIFSDDHIVCDHDEVVNLGALADDGATVAGAVHGDVGADLHLVLDLHVADLWDLLVGALGGLDVAEAVGADHDPAVERDPIAEDAAVQDSHARVEEAVLPDARALADKDEWSQDASRADGRCGLDDAEGPDRGIGRHLGVAGHDGGGVDAWGIGAWLGGESRGDLLEGRFRLLGDQEGELGGGGLEVGADDERGSGALGEVAGVLGVGQEGDLALTGVTQARDPMDEGFGVAVDGGAPISGPGPGWWVFALRPSPPRTSGSGA